jgi:hypothetical protein
MPGTAVGAGAVDEAATACGAEGTVLVAFGSGVHVAGNPNGVTVGICNEGPSGRCHAPLYSQTTKAHIAVAMTDKNAKMTF